MNKRTLLSGILCLSVLSCLTGCFVEFNIGLPMKAKFKGTRTVNTEHIPDTGIIVHSRNGAISVTKSERDDVEIIATLKATTEERLAAAEVIAERMDDQTLNIYVKWPKDKWKNREQCRFEIQIPNAKNIKLTTSNGAIQSAGLSGEAKLKTSNGRIKIDSHNGPVNASTSNGSIIAEHINGASELHTSNGRIRAINVISPVSARTSNGAVSLELGSNFVGEMTVSTSNGGLNVSGFDNAKMLSSGKKKISFSIGESDHKSSASTSNGSVSVKPYK